MGSRNMAWAIANQGGLSDGAARLLMLMAWHSMDSGRGTMPANVYARGWEFAAAMLYPDLEPATAQRRVARNMAELVTAGKAKPMGKATRKRRQNYQLMP